MPRRPEFLVLALDIGSSSTRAAFFDERGVPLPDTHAKQEYAIRYTAEGGAELSPQVLRRAAQRCVAEAMRARADSKSLRDVPICAISGCSLWHSLLGLDRSRKPVTPVFTWADSRSSPDAAQLRREFSEREVQLRTGCMLRANFWPAKLRWLQRTQPALCGRVSRWVSPADWIFRELFGVEGTSHSMASGTGFYNLRTGAWETELCRRCRINVEQLPKLGSGRADARPSGGTCFRMSASEIFLPIGDGAASNLGSGADRDGRIAINIGTSAAVRVIENGAGGRFPLGLFRYVVDAKRTLLGGAISNGGNLRRWCLRELNLDDASAEKAISRSAAVSDTLHVLPHWVTERAPTWPDNLQGTITGLTQTTTAADLLRALTTSTFYRLADILDLIDQHQNTRAEVIVSGGILKSPKLVQILADACGRDLRISRELETSIRGAAIHALEQLGYKTNSPQLGRIAKHSASLTAKHLVRRERQRELEQLFTKLSS